MASLKVITASAGLSGSGLISDFLLNRKDFISPFKNIPDDDQQSEFRFVSDPGGLYSLYEGLYENFSINNSAYVFNEFEKYLLKIKKFSIKKNGKKIFLYDKVFFNEVEKFKKKIIKLNYYGLPQFYRLGLNPKNKLIWKFTHKFKSAQEMKYLKMIIPVKKDVFIKEAQSFLERYLNKKKDNQTKNFIIDQGTNFWKPDISSIFFKNSKVILVTRDPRSVFSSMKTRKSLSFPGHDVDIFIKWYKLIMSKFDKKNFSKKVKVINYEQFILNHKYEKKKLFKFLGIKEKKNEQFNISKSKKNLFKANKNLTKNELKKISYHLREYLKWPKFISKD